MKKLLLALILIIPNNVYSQQIELDAWDAVGRAVSYCSGIGYQYDLMKKFEEFGATLQLVHPDGSVIKYHNASDQRTCKVEFVRFPVHGVPKYFIIMTFTYETEESHKVWHSLSEDATNAFCLGIRQTPLFGFVKTILPKDVEIMRNCELNDLTARKEKDE